jgi:multidrug efflux system outer membrane protein
MNSIMHTTTRSWAGRCAAAACVWLVCCAGCALIREDSPAARQLPPDRILLAQDIKLAREGWPEAQWWRRYGDAQLNMLVERAIRDAPVLAVARARVDASQARARLADANTGPVVGLSAEIDRERVSASGFLGPFATTNPAFGTTGPWYTAGTVGLVGSYSLDIWGTNRSRVTASIGMENAARAEAAQTEMLLSTQLMHAYYDIQTLFATTILLEQARDIETVAVAAHQARAERGVEPRTPFEQALAQKAELDRQIEAAHSRMQSLREAVRTLVGASPDGLPTITAVALPEGAGRLPPTLGFELLARRADLQAARWFVQASLDQVEAARAAFYPSFDIKGFLGFDALHLGDLFRGPSRQYNLIAGMSLPIFDSGRLNASLAVARTESNVLIAQYNQSVLQAVREVAQSAIELQSLQQQVTLQDAQRRAAEFASDSVHAQYQRGLADKVSALEARLPALQEQARVLLLRSAQLHAEIVLASALGGGYRAEGAAPPQSRVQN